MSNSVVVFRLTKLSRETASNFPHNPVKGQLRFNLNSAKRNKFYVDLEVDDVSPCRFQRLVNASQSLADYCLREAGAKPLVSEESYRARSYALVAELHSRGTWRFLAFGRSILSCKEQIETVRGLLSEFTIRLKDAIEEDRLNADYYLDSVGEEWEFVTACYYDYT